MSQPRPSRLAIGHPDPRTHDAADSVRLGIRHLRARHLNICHLNICHLGPLRPEMTVATGLENCPVNRKPTHQADSQLARQIDLSAVHLSENSVVRLSVQQSVDS